MEFLLTSTKATLDGIDSSKMTEYVYDLQMNNFVVRSAKDHDGKLYYEIVCDSAEDVSKVSDVVKHPLILSGSVIEIRDTWD